MVDLHRHDEFSLYDGFGKPVQLAKQAKQKGLSALGISNHGTTSGLAEHYYACKDVGIKPILGVEAYFQPNFSEDKANRYYHLCLFCLNLKGYKNLNRIMTTAWTKQFCSKPIVDFKLLEKYSEGIVCTSACIAGVLSQAIIHKKHRVAKKLIMKFKDIFGENFYVEIQPYKIDDQGTQETVNEGLMELAEENNVKCILTSDSHYGGREEFPTYLKMHEMKNSDLQKISDTYCERFMPEEGEMMRRFRKLHGNDPKNANRLATMVFNLEELENSFEPDILDQLPLSLPKIHGENSEAVFRQKIIDGLKKRGKYTEKYIERCKKEYSVIKHLGFIDYFLIVQDYVNWAKEQGIMVGGGRGSVCNCEIAYALGITEVDSIYFKLDFNRFMRKDKKKVPDVDIDFETEKRHLVIDYITEKYKGHSAQVISYGLYKGDNLLNDLFKVCNVESPSDKADLKSYVKNNIIDEVFDYDSIKDTKECKMWNKQYCGIIEHFALLYKQVRYYGTHAAGVAITGEDILDYTALEVHGGTVVTAYDLSNLEAIKVVKFDILGLKTMSAIKELRQKAGIDLRGFNYEWLEDKTLLNEFGAGNTEGIFQFESDGAKNILRLIKADCIEDILAGSALNRPAPLSLRMPEIYAHNKDNREDAESSPWYKYASESYGTIIYQEQAMRICRNIGNYEWSEVDRILKVSKGGGRGIKFKEREIEDLRTSFFKGAKENGYSKTEAENLFNSLLVYAFNKGHAAGYAMISIEQMFFKINYPELFWYVTLKYAAKEADLYRYKAAAVKEGNIILLPHVNYDVRYSIQKIEGERVLAEGLINIKNVGEKAAEAIVSERRKNGRYTSLEDFMDRIPKRTVNSRVVDALRENGALEFNKKIYFSRVKKYNSSLYLKG